MATELVLLPFHQISGPICRAFDLRQIRRSSSRNQIFLRFYKTSQQANIGLYEFSDEALRASYCKARGIQVIRRLTGGNAIYNDEHQIQFSLTIPKNNLSFDATLTTTGKAICRFLHTKSIPASFKAPNDIEIDGRKAGSIFIGSIGKVTIVHGVFFERLDVETMLKVLRVPKEKLNPEGVRTASQRFTTLPNLTESDYSVLGTLFAESFSRSAPSKLTKTGVTDVIEAPLPQINKNPTTALSTASPRVNQDHYRVFRKTRGGVLQAHILVHQHAGKNPSIEQIELGGSISSKPRSFFRKLSKTLVLSPTSDWDMILQQIQQTQSHDFLNFDFEELKYLLHQALERIDQRQKLDLSPDEANAIMLHDPHGNHHWESILKNSDTVLIPYCAKPNWCKWRHKEGCSECGLCEVGNIYQKAREKGLKILTIRNFEHLQASLAQMKESGTKAYVGMCCNNFYIKREHAFRNANMPALLIDIAGSNCYELGQEQKAYAGTFEAEATLLPHVTNQVIKLVPQQKLSIETQLKRRNSRNRSQRRQKTSKDNTVTST